MQLHVRIPPPYVFTIVYNS